MTTTLLFTLVVQFLLLLLAVSVHGAAQAWAAGVCGDPTPGQLGRAGLNPLRHFDLLGTLLFPAILLGFGFPVFGWGRPTPVVDANLRRPGWDGILVAAAGPVANLFLTGMATLSLIVAVHLLGTEGRQAGLAALIPQPGMEALPSFPVLFTLVRMAAINALVAAFHLIPVPPLDGGQIALRLLPPDWAARLAALRPYGFIIGVPAGMLVVPLLLVPFYGILAVVINFS